MDPSFIAEHPWSVVILDESALIRNPKAVRSKVCCKYLSQADYKAILSGLPNPESQLDFFQQMVFLRGEFMGCSNFWRWRIKFFVPDRFGYSWAPKPGTRQLVREAIKSRACIMSKKQAGLGNKHVHECRYVFLPKPVMRKYMKLLHEFAVDGESTKWAVVRYAWLRRIASGCGKEGSDFPLHSRKIIELGDLLTGELSKEQVIVWYCFKTEGNSIEENLRDWGIKAARISGKTPIGIRQKRRKHLESGKIRVLVMQIACGQYGLDLSAASTAIYFSEPPSHDQYAQSKERIEHPKKKEPLLSVSLIAKGTVDEDIRAALQLKRMSSQSMLHGLLEKLRRKVRG